jgi:hypothetical protein
MYEYTTKTPVSGMGWSELSALDNNNWYSPDNAMFCPYNSKERRICSTNNEQDLSAMRSAGCTRPYNYLFRETTANCTTAGGPAVSAGQTRVPGNPGTIWCCPENRPAPLPTTPEGIAWDQQNRAERQQAIQRGEVSSDGSPIPTSNIKTPVNSSNETSTGSSYIWVFGILGIATFSYFGYKYITSRRERV